MKKLTALFVTVAVLLSLFCGCNANQTELLSTSSAETQNPYEVVYPKVSARWMRYTLEKKKVEELKVAVEECRKIYNLADETKKDDFLKSLYSAMNVYARVKTQLGIAMVKYECDYNDDKAKKNYNEAIVLEKEASSILIAFLNEQSEINNPLAAVRAEFKNEQFPNTISAEGDYQGWWITTQKIANEINSIKSTASDEEVLELYKKYIVSANVYAERCYYENYYEFAHNEIYHRDYIAADRQDLRTYVKQYLVPLCYEIEEKSKKADAELSADEYNRSLLYSNASYTEFEDNLISDYIKSLGITGEKSMQTAFGEDRIVVSKADSARINSSCFTVGDTPICYFHKSKTNLENVIHTLGYYYANLHGKSEVVQDLAEVYGKANKLLFLSYTSGKLNSPAFDAYELYCVYNTLYQMISSAIHDEFNEIVFSMDNPDSLTVEKIEEILTDLMTEYGVLDFGDSFKKQILTYWKRLGVTNVGYNISYVTSGVVALEIYQKSLVDYSAGVELYNLLIQNEYSNTMFSAPIVAVDLKSPFVEDAYKLAVQIKNHLPKNSAKY